MEVGFAVMVGAGLVFCCLGVIDADKEGGRGC